MQLAERVALQGCAPGNTDVSDAFDIRQTFQLAAVSEELYALCQLIEKCSVVCVRLAHVYKENVGR